MLIICANGAILGVLEDSIVDAYVTMSTGKEIWDALEAIIWTL
jgi:hypothetical protein